MLGLVKQLPAILAGWKGYAAAAAAGLALGVWLTWQVAGWKIDAERAAQLAEANRSLLATIEDMKAEAAANEAALAAAIARAQAGAAQVQALEEELKHVDPAKDCLPDPSLQPLTDGLR